MHYIFQIQYTPGSMLCLPGLRLQNDTQTLRRYYVASALYYTFVTIYLYCEYFVYFYMERLITYLAVNLATN